MLSISKIWDLLKMPCYGHLFCFLLWNLIPHKHSKVYFCAFLQEDLGHWELCVVHFTEKHARERPQEGRWIPHEAEPVAVWSQTERPDGGSSPDQLPGGAERPQVFWREIFRGHLDGRTSIFIMSWNELNESESSRWTKACKCRKYKRENYHPHLLPITSHILLTTRE